MGPAGIPIMLQDITFNGEVLALGAIDENGRFKVNLPRSLEVGHRIGITLGDLTGTGLSREQFYLEDFYGEEALTVPQVGFFFDTYMIRE
jgi:hypothetical protein